MTNRKLKSKAIPILIMLATGLVLVVQLSLSRDRHRRLQAERQKRDTEMAALYSHGFYDTIIMRIKQVSEPSDRDGYWLIRSYLAAGRYDAAARRLSAGGISDALALRFELAEAYVSAGRSDKAFATIASERSAMRETDGARYRKLVEQTFSPISRTAIAGEYLSGWHGRWAIVQDSGGSFLVSRKGRPADGRRYESIRPTAGGFEVIHNGEAFLLNDQLNVVTGEGRTARRSDEGVSDEAKGGLHLEAAGSGVRLYYDDIAVSPVYEAAGSLDPDSGHLIVKQDGKWMILHILCLGMGYND